MRVKQDVVPGKKQLSWFQATKTGKYDLVCAELCGWGHYKMKGQLTVEPRSQFQQYLEDLRIEQNRATDPELPSQTDESDDE
jgi:cytochrome c oxidase subunit 2